MSERIQHERTLYVESDALLAFRRRPVYKEQVVRCRWSILARAPTFLLAGSSFRSKSLALSNIIFFSFDRGFGDKYQYV